MQPEDHPEGSGSFLFQFTSERWKVLADPLGSSAMQWPVPLRGAQISFVSPPSVIFLSGETPPKYFYHPNYMYYILCTIYYILYTIYNPLGLPTKSVRPILPTTSSVRFIHPLRSSSIDFSNFAWLGGRMIFGEPFDESSCSLSQSASLDPGIVSKGHWG